MTAKRKEKERDRGRKRIIVFFRDKLPKLHGQS